MTTKKGTTKKETKKAPKKKPTPKVKLERVWSGHGWVVRKVKK